MGVVNDLKGRPAVGINADGSLAMNFTMGFALKPGDDDKKNGFGGLGTVIPFYFSYAKFSENRALLGLESGFRWPIFRFSFEATTKLGATLPLSSENNKTGFAIMPTVTFSAPKDLINIQVSTLAYSTIPQAMKRGWQVTLGMDLMPYVGMLDRYLINRE